MKYRMKDFLVKSELMALPAIQERALFPFTMECAMRFFDNFVDEVFDFEEKVQSIVIWDAKEILPKKSYAKGFLCPQSLDDDYKIGELKEIGSIYFEYGGETASPIIRVSKE